MSTWIFSALGAALGSMTIAEMRDFSGWLAKRVVKRAAGMLPEADQESREEEWAAVLDARTDGLKLFRFFYSLGFLIAGSRLRRQAALYPDLASIDSLRFVVGRLASERRIVAGTNASVFLLLGTAGVIAAGNPLFYLPAIPFTFFVAVWTLRATARVRDTFSVIVTAPAIMSAEDRDAAFFKCVGPRADMRYEYFEHLGSHGNLDKCHECRRSPDSPRPCPHWSKEYLMSLKSVL